MIGPGNLIGGSASGAGNVISANGRDGISLFPGYSSRGDEVPAVENTIQGNLIGTDITGTVALPNGGDGIILPAYGNRVGGTASQRNVISGNRGNGITVTSGYGSDTLMIAGNLIGTQIDGRTALGNSGDGIRIGEAGRTVVGATSGPNASAGNVIAFNGGDGIVLAPPRSTDSPVAQRISANSIHDNGNLGIDLGDNGVTPNDAGDADTGANGLQNYPVISSAFGCNGNLTIYGNLNSTPAKTFTLEFFANAAADSSGFGEGQVFLGQANLTTDSAGNAAFNVTFPLPASALFATATATGAEGTSEFSAAVPIAPTAPTQPAPPQTAVVLPTHPSQLLNISTRMRVSPGEYALIGGFIVTGNDPKKLLIRGLGPSLSSSGVSNLLADPVLELHDGGGQLITTNDNWKTDQRTEIEGTGIPPTNDLESAIVRTLGPGNYTAILSGRNDTAGVGLVEVYDLSTSSPALVANISTRGGVGTGDDVMIGGFIVGGNGGGSTDVVVRALGPSIVGLISPRLDDPMLELRNGNGSLIQASDDWVGTTGWQDVCAVGLAPQDNRESAIYATVAPGNYTAIVRGKNNTAGIALVEVYDVGH